MFLNHIGNYAKIFIDGQEHIPGVALDILVGKILGEHVFLDIILRLE